MTLEAVRQVIDPAQLRYISWSHLEADESGALNEFLQIAPQAEAVHSELGVIVNVKDFAIRPAKIMGDGEVLDLGQHKLRFLITPQVPHCWDAILAFEETTGTLMASDLFKTIAHLYPGEPAHRPGVRSVGSVAAWRAGVHARTSI